VLIAEGIDRADFVALAEGELGPGFIIRIQMGILDAMLRFQTDPFDIVFRGHGMLNRSHCDMDGIIIHIIHGGMLFSRCFGSAGCDLVHLFAATDDRNALIPNHGDDIAAVLANIKFLLHIIPPHKKSVSEIALIIHL
jgi:hypothetical protein